jgi:apolipoprotein N-acyltransferase
LCESKRGLSAAKFPVLVKILMCDACRLLGTPWLPELHGGAAYQHAANSVLRAVETRRPVLRCGNGGWSGWIDEFGNVRAVLVNDTGSIYFRGTQTFAVTRDARWMNRPSFYVEHGDWFVAVSAALILFGFVLLQSGKPSEHR